MIHACFLHFPSHMNPRIPHAGQFVPQINEALAAQASRMELAVAEEKKRKAAVAAGIIEPRKRPNAESDRVDVKRVKLETTSSPAAPPNSSVYSFDFSTLPATLITDLIVANLEAFTEPTLIALVQAYRQRMGIASSSVPTPAAPEPAPAVEDLARPQTPPPTSAPVPPVQEEPVDPLQMDIDQDELEYEPDQLNEEVMPFLYGAGLSS